MSRFIETILAENGEVIGLAFHQQRLNETLRDHGSNASIDLDLNIAKMDVPQEPKSKIRVLYDISGIIRIEISSYAIRTCRSFSLVDIGEKKYKYKYADREWIYACLHNAGTDEIIMASNGLITDASIANLAFFNGEAWHTPLHPLLSGTKRKALLENGIIKAEEIDTGDLSKYSSFKLVNAMMGWDESPVYSTDLIIRA